MRDVTAFRPRELRVAARPLGALPPRAIVRRALAPTPFGACTIGVLEGTLAWLSFGEASSAEVEARLACTVREDGEDLVRPFAERLFVSPRASLAVTLVGTPFQLRVWCALLAVPYGATTTYGTLAADLGDPRLARAVGQAVGANPIAIVVPCHRVLRAGGSLGGYRWGVERKSELLACEASEGTASRGSSGA